MTTPVEADAIFEKVFVEWQERLWRAVRKVKGSPNFGMETVLQIAEAQLNEFHSAAPQEQQPPAQVCRCGEYETCDVCIEEYRRFRASQEQQAVCVKQFACSECPYVFTQAEVDAEDKDTWGHPCHGLNVPTGMRCESYRAPQEAVATPGEAGIYSAGDVYAETSQLFPPEAVHPFIVEDLTEQIWKLTNDRDGWSRITLRGLLESFVRGLTPSPSVAQKNQPEGNQGSAAMATPNEMANLLADDLEFAGFQNVVADGPVVNFFYHGGAYQARPQNQDLGEGGSK